MTSYDLQYVEKMLKIYNSVPHEDTERILQGELKYTFAIRN